IEVANGYAGGNSGHPNGYAPDGVPGASENFAGGAHGGRGIYGTSQVFDSVYEPRLAGGGGAKGYEPWHNGTPGGGVLRIEAGEVELQGELLAGAPQGCGGGAGAGGAVLIQTGTLSGSGSIDASGGSEVPWCAYGTGPGGGGRVSLVADAFQSFDPAVQVKVWGGAESGNVYAAPGTLYYKLPAHQFGVLSIDNGQVNGADRSAPLTQLPTLGSGTLSGFESIQPAGTDAWIARTGGFTAEWRGVWVKLTGASGVLGTYKAAELGADGRLRLAGAGGLTGATGYAGEYRFDRIDLLHGSGFDAADPVGGSELVIQGNAEVTGEIRALDVRIKSGAVVKPATGGELRIIASGRLTVEAGAVIDLQGRGYEGGTGAHPDGFAPVWVAGAAGGYAGGAHGGRGDRGTSQVFDSVYEPRLGGGGGARGSSNGNPGGGVLLIEAAEVVLDGELRASAPTTCNSGGGGGGTVSIEAGTLSGAGRIDASGSEEVSYCGWASGPGGGGRVALHVGTLAGFDPATQVKVWGGQANGESRFAAPGTVYVKLPAHTWGVLRIDSGELNGVDRINVPTSSFGPGPYAALPVLGSGSIGSLTPDGEDDARVGRSTPFTDEWRGAWMALFDAAGAELGVYRVADVDAQGRALLLGAQGIAAATYQGEYRFDRVEVANGAILETPDRLLTAEFGGILRIGTPIKGESLRLKAGSKITPLTGGELSFTIAGELAIETGVVIDVSGLGYPEAAAPPGVAPASGWANGGNHGGAGGISEFYDSVYQPWLPGAGGTAGGSRPGWPGGGVVRIDAGSLVLDGTIRARGQDAGAGGTVRVRTTGILSGTGQIDVSGGVA
ncbi:MAG TPA: hypothetical protein VEB65_02260, partial [Solirubrobacterales bacterium]|nr:hypothetical protein [Solirubrobacterales bacterium]